jgi:hypothetical protein
MDKKHSAATKRKISLAQRGRKNSFYGRRHKRSTLARLAAKNKGKNNPMFGHRHSAAAKEKIRQAALKRTRKAK